MSIRLDPRRVNALKHLAGEAGVRPGDLVRQWVEERIDASRGGAAEPAAMPGGESLLSRLEALAARIAALEAAGGATTQIATEAPETSVAPTAPKKRGRPKTRVSATPRAERVALHDEMIAVINERGPLPAAELAEAITQRGRYAPPRSGKPLDAAMVSQRVSNPTYRSRFRRSDGRIGLAE